MASWRIAALPHDLRRAKMVAKIVHFLTGIQLNTDEENPEAWDEVGSMMLTLYSKMQAEPLSPKLMKLSLSCIPVGRFDDSKMRESAVREIMVDVLSEAAKKYLCG